jgi:hypothetical protein
VCPTRTKAHGVASAHWGPPYPGLHAQARPTPPPDVGDSRQRPLLVQGGVQVSAPQHLPSKVASQVQVAGPVHEPRSLHGALLLAQRPCSTQTWGAQSRWAQRGPLKPNGHSQIGSFVVSGNTHTWPGVHCGWQSGSSQVGPLQCVAHVHFGGAPGPALGSSTQIWCGPVHWGHCGLEHCLQASKCLHTGFGSSVIQPGSQMQTRSLLHVPWPVQMAAQLSVRQPMCGSVQPRSQVHVSGAVHLPFGPQIGETHVGAQPEVEEGTHPASQAHGLSRAVQLP